MRRIGAPKRHEAPLWLIEAVHWASRNRWRLSALAGCFAIVWSYLPIVTYQFQKPVFERNCLESRQAKLLIELFSSNVSLVSAKTTGFSDIEVRLISGGRNKDFVLMEMPVVLGSEQVPLGQHPAYRDLVSGHHGGVAIANGLVDYMDRYCDLEPPFLLHDYIIQFASSKSAESIPETQTPEGPTLKPDSVNEVQVAEY